MSYGPSLNENISQKLFFDGVNLETLGTNIFSTFLKTNSTHLYSTNGMIYAVDSTVTESSNKENYLEVDALENWAKYFEALDRRIKLVLKIDEWLRGRRPCTWLQAAPQSNWPVHCLDLLIGPDLERVHKRNNPTVTTFELVRTGERWKLFSGYLDILETPLWAQISSSRS